MNRPTHTLTEDAIEARLRQGLRNRWYPIYPSNRAGPTPVSVWRLGEKLVLWRDGGGRICVQEDHCPHRGAPLSLGRVAGDRLACVYHGVEISSAGQVLRVPGSPGCSLEGRYAVKTYPSREIAGAVFAWFGDGDEDGEHAEPAAFDPPPQLVSDEYERFHCYTEWRTPYRYMIDNNLDPMHGAFLHRLSHSMAEGDYSARFEVRDTAHGFVVEKVDQRDVNFDWSEWCDEGAFYARLEIPYPKRSGPGGNFGIIFMIAPIDERHSACFFWRNRKVSGWQRHVWQFLYRNRLEGRHWAVLEQDRVVAEGMEPDACERESLYDHDIGVVRVRRWMRQQAIAQLSPSHSASTEA